jgi:hypothetical protein
MLYVANFGVRQLMIRLPKSLVNMATLQPYCVPYCIATSTTKNSVIVDIHLNCEDYYDWIEGEEGWLSSLVAVRNELLQGDLRVLYLAWLRSSFTEDNDAELSDLIEPPVPSNLKQLSPALQAFADLFLVDQDLIAAAAEASPDSQAIAEPIEEWVAALPEAERNHYLVRMAKGETYVGGELMQRLRELFSHRQPLTNSQTASRRSLANLVEIADEKRKQRQRKEQQAAAKARRN